MAKTGTGCGIVTMVLVLLWLGISAYAADYQHENNPHYAFAEYFILIAFLYFFVLLIPALLIAWISGVVNHIRWLNSLQATEAKQQTEMLSRIYYQQIKEACPTPPVPPEVG